MRRMMSSIHCCLIPSDDAAVVMSVCGWDLRRGLAHWIINSQKDRDGINQRIFSSKETRFGRRKRGTGSKSIGWDSIVVIVQVSISN